MMKEEKRVARLLCAGASTPLELGRRFSHGKIGGLTICDKLGGLRETTLSDVVCLFIITVLLVVYDSLFSE